MLRRTQLSRSHTRATQQWERGQHRHLKEMGKWDPFLLYEKRQLPTSQAVLRLKGNNIMRNNSKVNKTVSYKIP